MLNGTFDTLNTLSDWLDYIESLHSADIEFGLTRVSEVFARLFPQEFSCRVITVGGTNGKGSTCSLIEQILIQAGFSCGKNTSPHIDAFNERITVNGCLASDADIVRAFQKVDLSRQEVELTYFEFTFLAALVVFDEQNLDFAICEVGLGGRLDAVNILSPEVSVITNIGLDHTQWLGDTRDAIAAEKIAVARTGMPCIIGDTDLPLTAQTYISDHRIPSLINSKDFTYRIESNYWQIDISDTVNSVNAKSKSGSCVINSCLIKVKQGVLKNLPLLSGQHQYQNASCAILAVLSLSGISLEKSHIDYALTNNYLVGRCQVLNEKPLIIIDVAHNQDSVHALSQFVESKKLSKQLSEQLSKQTILDKNVVNKTYAVVSMLDDKDIELSLSQISSQIDEWHIAELAVPRAASKEKIHAAIAKIQPKSKVYCYDSIESAHDSVKKSLDYADCLVVFGSFFVVSDILRHY